MKRINITLPDSIHDLLVDWAESQGRPAANLAAFIIEKEISEAKDRGEIKPLAKTLGSDRHET
jgi:hypothetical protein